LSFLSIANGISVKPGLFGGLYRARHHRGLQHRAVGILLDPLARPGDELDPSHGLNKLINGPGMVCFKASLGQFRRQLDCHGWLDLAELREDLHGAVGGLDIHRRIDPRDQDELPGRDLERVGC